MRLILYVTTLFLPSLSAFIPLSETASSCCKHASQVFPRNFVPSDNYSKKRSVNLMATSTLSSDTSSSKTRTKGKRKQEYKKWGSMVSQLKEYKEKHGHTRLKEEDNPTLYEWTKSLRYNYGHQVLNKNKDTSTNSKRPHLSEAKLKELEEIEFDWGSTRKVKKWETMLPRLSAFHKKHGHTMVSPSDDADLCQWTKTIRANYSHQVSNEDGRKAKSSSSKGKKRAKLSKEKLDSLQKLNFCWDLQAAKWEQNYRDLSNFQKKYGHCHVPISENRRLATFVQNQRQQYRLYLAGNSTSMTPERIKNLSKINFEWPQEAPIPRPRTKQVTWDVRYAELEEYWQKHGHSNVPQDCSDNFELGQWCMNQRTNYRMNQEGIPTGLSTQRILKLEKLDFAWSIRRTRWGTMFQRLKAYQEEHGHLEIPVSDSNNSDLRQWLNEQRFFYRTNSTSRMTEERVETLESIPDFSWRRKGERGPSKDDWSELFVAIREKGIAPGGKIKQHWFDGAERFSTQVKTEWTEQELLALWNEENEDGDDDEYFDDDEKSASFLRA